jgi:hypothetical protein
MLQYIHGEKYTTRDHSADSARPHKSLQRAFDMASVRVMLEPPKACNLPIALDSSKIVWIGVFSTFS